VNGALPHASPPAAVLLPLGPGLPPGDRAAVPELAPSSLSPASDSPLLEPPPRPRRRPDGLSMLDLFAGSGSASRAALVRGWHVCRVDVAPGTAHDVRADLATWEPGAEPWDLVWASPPCTQLSTASTVRDVEAGLVLVRAAVRIIRAVAPRWWVLENVHGATRAIGDLIGPPVATYGSFYLWGVFPPFEAVVPRNKTKLSGRRRAERRAAIPWAVSLGLVRACEELARELDVR
jgi:hypothetical protein